MLRKLEVKNPGDSGMLVGEIVDKSDAKNKQRIKARGKERNRI